MSFSEPETPMSSSEPELARAFNAVSLQNFIVPGDRFQVHALDAKAARVAMRLLRKAGHPAQPVFHADADAFAAAIQKLGSTPGSLSVHVHGIMSGPVGDVDALVQRMGVTVVDVIPPPGLHKSGRMTWTFKLSGPCGCERGIHDNLLKIAVDSPSAASACGVDDVLENLHDSIALHSFRACESGSECRLRVDSRGGMLCPRALVRSTLESLGLL
jgi:hypothetical protein